MSLAYGRSQLAIPGPSNIPDRVLQAMMRPAPNIYEGALVEMTNSILEDLKIIARTKGDVAFYISNGHGVWEAAITNTLSRGDRILALVTGRFTRGWIEVATELGVEVVTLDFGPRAPIDSARVSEALQDDPSLKAVIMVQTDTASSIRNDVLAIRAAIDAADHDALLMVDCIASLACEPYEMDAWGVDVTLAASQKGLMTPPGLGFTFISEKAWTAHQHADLVTPYWDWTRRVKGPLFYHRFFGTAPTHLMFGLHEALGILLKEEGLENAWKRHALLAEAVWAAIDAWGAQGAIRCNIDAPENRSTAVTTVCCDGMDASILRRWCEENANLVVGVALDLNLPDGPTTNDMFRIGHMGHLNPPMLLGALATLDAGLKACGFEHGSGALDAAAELIASAQRF